MPALGSEQPLRLASDFAAAGGTLSLRFETRLGLKRERRLTDRVRDPGHGAAADKARARGLFLEPLAPVVMMLEAILTLLNILN